VTAAVVASVRVSKNGVSARAAAVAMKIFRAVAGLVLCATLLGFGMFLSLSYRPSESIVFDSIRNSFMANVPLPPTSRLAIFPVNQAIGMDSDLSAGNKFVCIVQAILK
jgi:hypothetical protein